LAIVQGNQPQGNLPSYTNHGINTLYVVTLRHEEEFSPKQQAFETPSFTPLSAAESESLEHFRRFQQEMRDGPFYAFLETPAHTPKPGELSGSGAMGPPRAGRDTVAGNPFESMRTYSQKFVRSKKTVPRLAQRKYGASCVYPSRFGALTAWGF
jgi:DNA-directed RNA polymerase III subunit Rpc31